MGNLQICTAAQSEDKEKLYIYGTIINSQTRALMSIMDTCQISYTLRPINDIFKQNNNNNNNPSETDSNIQAIFMSKAMPMLAY